MKNRLLIALLLTLGLLGIGCQRSIPSCPLPGPDQAYLKRFLLTAQALPGFRNKILSQSYQEIAGPIEEKDKVYILTESWQQAGQKLNISYHLYPNPEKAESSFRTMVSGFPAGFNVKKFPGLWETQSGKISRIYFQKDRLLFILESDSEPLVKVTAQKILRPGR